VVQHITLDPNDATTTGAIDSYHANVDDAVARGYLTPEQAAAEKRSAALRLLGAEYSLMARRDPERAMRELGSPETADPLVAHLPQQQRDALMRDAQRRQDGAQADAARATCSRNSKHNAHRMTPSTPPSRSCSTTDGSLPLAKLVSKSTMNWRRRKRSNTIGRVENSPASLGKRSE
jgi:hypothetical protein